MPSIVEYVMAMGPIDKAYMIWFHRTMLGLGPVVAIQPCATGLMLYVGSVGQY